MKFASLTDRLKTADDAEGDPWEVHHKANMLADKGEDVIFLSIGQESDEVTPSIIVDAAVNSLQQGDHHYTQASGDPSLRNSIANYHNKLTAQDITAENCIVFSGAQNALYSIAQVLLEPGDEVIVSEPYYTTYASTFSSSGATLVNVVVRKEHDYQLHIDDIAAAITPNTQAIVLNSPNNPMGSLYAKDDFAAVVALCIKHHIWLILDSVYLDIVDVPTDSLPHTIQGAADVLITVGSLSKSHRMTGWRIGWAVAPIEVIIHLANLSMCMHYGLPPFIMKAAQVAVDQSMATPILVRDTLARRRALAVPILSHMQTAKLQDSGQGMFMLIDVSPLGLTAHQFAMQLLIDHNVAVLPCDGFGKAGKYLVRVGLCVDDAKLEKACEKIVDCIATLAQKTGTARNINTIKKW